MSYASASLTINRLTDNHDHKLKEWMENIVTHNLISVSIKDINDLNNYNVSFFNYIDKNTRPVQ